MRAAAWAMVTCALMACGGDKSGTGDSSPTAGDDDDEPVVIDCTTLPLYELDSLDCAQLGNAFENTMDAAEACNTDQDCIMVRPQCEHWNDVGCFYAANYCVGGSSTIVAEFNSASTGCNDASDVCDCGSPPAVKCEAKKCVIADTTPVR